MEESKLALNKSNQLIALATLCTSLEYFNYALYQFLLPSIAISFFATLTAPEAVQASLYLLCFSTIAKSVGRVVFARLSDLHGRAYSLKRNLIGTGLFTMAIGLCPGPNILGAELAILTLLIFRSAQAYCVGGEYDSMSVILYESLPSRANLANSFLAMATGIGYFLANLLVGFSLHSLPLPYNWRLPLILSGLFGTWLYQKRALLVESPQFKKSAKANTFLKFLQENWRFIIKLAIIFGTVGAFYQYIFVYRVMSAEKILSSRFTFVQYSIYCLSCLIVGYLADQINSFKLMYIGAISIGLCLISEILWSTASGFYYCQISLVIMLPLIYVPASVQIMHYCKVENRCKFIGIGHGLGGILLSGSAVLICQTLKINVWQRAPEYYMFVLILVYVWTLMQINKESYN